MSSIGIPNVTSSTMFYGNKTFGAYNSDDLVAYFRMKPISEVIAFLLLSIAVLGNSFTIGTILLDKQSRKFCSAYLFNICLADALFAIVNIAGETIFATWDMRMRLKHQCVEYSLI